MQGTVSQTPGNQLTVHTYTAPELGWRANTHIIELPTQLVLFDAQLTPTYAREVVAIATALRKPIARLYISHAHPDHFAGAGDIDAPTYALASVKELIDRSGDLRIERGYQYTPGHADTEPVASRPIDHVVEAGEEVIDGVRFSFEPIEDAETTEQLAIGLPSERMLIAPDVLYHGVHLFIGEHAFDAWEAAIARLEARPYDIILPGHGLPGDRAIYDAQRAYLVVAREAFAQASGPDDLNHRLEVAFPEYGGSAMQGLQNFYLFPERAAAEN
jgi:glyoxylase-like metal-dependent hydrolase (beta-lactamase superfamily II)